MSSINSRGPHPVYTIEDHLPGFGVHVVTVVLLKTAALSGIGTRVTRGLEGFRDCKYSARGTLEGKRLPLRRRGHARKSDYIVGR
jgi:hypothetical protein